MSRVNSMALYKPKNDTKKIDLDYIGSREEQAETRTIASRQRLRADVDDQIEAFLRSGGNIENIESNVTANSPGKPHGNYGSRPI